MLCGKYYIAEIMFGMEIAEGFRVFFDAMIDLKIMKIYSYILMNIHSFIYENMDEEEKDWEFEEAQGWIIFVAIFGK